MDKLLIVSGDGHLGAEPETYRPYFEARFRDMISELEAENKWFCEVRDVIHPKMSPDMLEAVDPDKALRTGGDKGAWDIKRRMQELDREGVAAEIVFPGHQLAIQPFFSVVNNTFPAEVRAAGQRAYHRWAAECFAESGGRMFGVAEPGPCLNMAETIRELRWCADNAFRSVQPPGNTSDPDLPPLTDLYYEPFWAACAELGLVINAHAGFGQPQGRFWEFSESFLRNTVGATETNIPKSGNMMEAFESAEDSPFQLDMGPRRIIWQMMLAGVFDRHPNLKLAVTEVRADWLPATLKRLDELAARKKTPLKMTPSEYWARNCFVTPSSIHICEMEMRDQIGVDTLIFGTDYPHPEGTWPNTKEWIRMTFKGVPEMEARKILGENTIRCFGLDRDKLMAIANRIGFTPSDVLVSQADVHPLCLKNLNQRGGILNGAEKVRTEDIDPLFEQDLQRVA